MEVHKSTIFPTRFLARSLKIKQERFRNNLYENLESGRWRFLLMAKETGPVLQDYSYLLHHAMLPPLPESIPDEGRILCSQESIKK